MWAPCGETVVEIPAMLMTLYYLYQDSEYDWLKICFIQSEVHCTTQIWVVTRHQYGISALVSTRSLDVITWKN